MGLATERLKIGLRDRYRIERELGAGGMATVYLAEDLRHGRKVAIKVLRPELAAIIGAERFVREIKTIAALQHPHILGLIDSGEVDGTAYYVMPFVEGESLRDRLNREKQLPVADAVRITTEVASALDYAHRRGIIHRDIKPENILLHEGSALVADFGIALAVSQAGGGTRLTETGMSLGTPHYMSPEQAMGQRDVGPPSDVYSLGAVTYELLTGEPPFNAPTAQAIVARVMTEAPRSITAQRHTVPPALEAAVMRALEKLPADRFASAGAFAAALTEDAPARPRTAAPAPIAAPTVSRWRAPALPWVIAGLAVAGLVAAVLWPRPRQSPPQPISFAVQLPPGTSPTTLEREVALSADGRRLVVNARVGGRDQLLTRDLGSMDLVPVPGSEDAVRPFLSPDGRWIACTLKGQLVKIPAEGGPPVVVAPVGWGGGTWGPDGTLVYSVSYLSGLWRVSSNGGVPQQLTEPDTAHGELAHWWPQFLPDGRHVIFGVFRTPSSRARIEVLDLRTGRRKLLVTGGMYGRYSPDGHLLYVVDGALLSVAFDPNRLEVTGAPVSVVPNVAMVAAGGFAAYDMSASGTLAYIPARPGGDATQPVWVGRDGRERPVAGLPAGDYQSPELSPDGQRIAISRYDQAGKLDVWVYDLARRVMTRATSGAGSDFGAVWTRDGSRLIYSSERPVFDLYTRPADGGGQPAVFLHTGNDKFAGSVSPDGKFLVFSTALPGKHELRIAPIDSPAASRTLPANDGRFGPARATISPEGSWLAYDDDDGGPREVYLQSYPGASRRVQVSNGGGHDPHWTKGGRELVYLSDDSMYAVAVDPAGRVGRPVALFGYGRGEKALFVRTFAVRPDGSEFLMLKAPADPGLRQVDVVVGWTGR